MIRQLFKSLKPGLVLLMFCLSVQTIGQRSITFCGEPIPVSRDAVAYKLMNVIKRYIPTLNGAVLRRQIKEYLPYIEKKLIENNLPTDFKYLPIVESHFKLASSHVGARGFWQFMPATASDYGLRMDEIIDERDDFYKSTDAACKLLRNYYNFLKNNRKVASWTLTAAAYNYGNGNIDKAIRNMGTDYYSMNLNEETAMYVYKIIAVKELLERPELYLGSLSTNIFAAEPTIAVATSSYSKTLPVPPPPVKEILIEKETTEEDVAEFTSIALTTKEEETPLELIQKMPRYRYYQVRLVDDLRDFTDGSLADFELQEPIRFVGGYYSKKSSRTGKCYRFEDRIVVNLGDPDFTIVSPDENGALVKGISSDKLKKRSELYIRVEE